MSKEYERLREAVRVWDMVCDANRSRGEPMLGYSIELRDAAAAVLALPSREALTADERAMVELERAKWMQKGSAVADLLAILDDHFPRPAPQIEHKPCWNCGGRPRLRENKFPRPANKPVCVDCECGVSGPFCKTDAAAWAMWDARAPLEEKR